ncbi:NYN domain-containing protein [Motilibacter deserti]|uniref:NYN domain-containing protein n=1 Tax=Motilibacter deserti TaxID=2714956 RepID=UPI002F2B1D9A
MTAAPSPGPDDRPADGSPPVGPVPADDARRDDDAEPATVVLPESVRARVVALADETLSGLAPGEAPASLRPFLRFTAGKRARHAGPALAAALEADEPFRSRVAARVRERRADLAAAVDAGRPPAAAEPVEVAAVAYVLRAPGWQGLVAAASEEALRAVRQADASKAAAEAERLSGQLAAARAQAREEADRLRAELATVKAEVADLRRRLHKSREDARSVKEGAHLAQEQADAVRADAQTRVSAAESEARKLRERLAEAEAELETARRVNKEGRALADARVRLLLDVVADAASGLRRELALPATDLRPADVIAAGEAGSAVSSVGARAMAADDPAVLDDLLALPRVHLVVDGYNVTKLGYGNLSLQDQRERLVNGLASLAARTGAEVTCCFDGAAVDVPVVIAKPRNVRVLFSLPGEIADELIRRLVANEPEGRPVVVVSSDKEVAEGVRRSGARPVASAALLKRLDRG